MLERSLLLAFSRRCLPSLACSFAFIYAAPFVRDGCPLSRCRACMLSCVRAGRAGLENSRNTSRNTSRKRQDTPEAIFAGETVRHFVNCTHEEDYNERINEVQQALHAHPEGQILQPAALAEPPRTSKRTDRGPSCRYRITAPSRCACCHSAPYAQECVCGIANAMYYLATCRRGREVCGWWGPHTPRVG